MRLVGAGTFRMLIRMMVPGTISITDRRYRHKICNSFQPFCAFIQATCAYFYGFLRADNLHSEVGTSFGYLDEGRSL